MLSENLIRRLLGARRRAAKVLFRSVSFRDGSKPVASNCHENVTRWICENPKDQAIRGWLVTSGFLFDKHSVVMDDNAGLFDITPLAYPTPFIRHPGTNEEFDEIKQAQLVLTTYANLDPIE